MPKKKKTIWLIFMLIVGLVVAFSRIGVGAHYPLDVIIGSVIGYIVAVMGIKINNKINWLSWIKDKKYYPIFIVLLIACVGVIIKKIVHTNLLILYITLSALLLTLYSIINAYVKKY